MDKFKKIFRPTVILIIIVVFIIVVVGMSWKLIEKEAVSVVSVVNFEDCVANGNPVMESYPRQCRHDDQTFIEELPPAELPPTELPPTETKPLTIKCLPEQRSADVCATIYQPVCATVNIQCIKAPCNPIQETFSNSCNACKNSLVESYVVGECL